MNNKPEPSEDTSKLLRDYLHSFKALPFLAPSARSTPFATNLLSLAILSVDKEDPKYEDEKIKPFRDILNKNENDLKFATKSLEILNKILESDSHLKVCCDRPFNLAYILDEYFLKYIYQLSTLGIKVNEEQIEILYAELLSILYERGYSRNAYFHLYNFEYVEDVFKFEDLSIIKLDEQFIPRLLGEKGSLSQFHDSGIGNYFIQYSDNMSPDDYPTWLDTKHIEARRILSLLQFLKDGVIDIDYYTIYFTPSFVNEIWRFGNYYNGDIKSTGRTNKYILTKEDINTLLQYRSVQTKFASRFNEANSQLGKVLTLAERHFANYHSKEIIEEQLLDLIISLESLYSPDDRIELSHRIRQYAGIFLGNQMDSRDVYEFLNEMLRKRGALVHGGYDIREVEEGKFLSDDEIMKLASIVRKSLINFTVLYLKGEDSRTRVHNMIQDAAFYNDKADELKDAVNVDKFIEENI
jgi:hypothetical protein